MTTLNALLVQAQLGWKEPSRNRAHLEKLMEGVGGGFDLAVLPETFTTGFLGDTDMPDEGMDGPTVEWMKSLSARYGAALSGSAVIVEDGHRYNRMLFVTPEGMVTHYDKRHLFAYGGENQRYTAGSRRVNVDYRGWRINLQVCYDLRFPAWCRYRGDFDLTLLVANWPTPRVRHWSSLLEARAIENQSWVIGVNRVGQDGKGVDYPGASVVHDPLGECVAHLGDQEACQIVHLDLSAVENTRKQFPFHADADAFELTP